MMFRNCSAMVVFTLAVVFSSQSVFSQFGGVQVQVGGYGRGVRIDNLGYGNTYNGYGYGNAYNGYGNRYNNSYNGNYGYGNVMGNYPNSYYGNGYSNLGSQYVAPRAHVVPFRGRVGGKYRYR
jgi:hypothetical protein